MEGIPSSFWHQKIEYFDAYFWPPVFIKFYLIDIRLKLHYFVHEGRWLFGSRGKWPFMGGLHLQLLITISIMQVPFGIICIAMGSNTSKVSTRQHQAGALNQDWPFWWSTRRIGLIANTSRTGRTCMLVVNHSRWSRSKLELVRNSFHGRKCTHV